MTAVGVLGPLLLSGPDGPIRLGSARQRRLHAAALLGLLGGEHPDHLAQPGRADRAR